MDYTGEIDTSYSDIVKPAVKASIQWNICSSLKKCSTDPNSTQFVRDITRNFEIYLPGGKQLTNDFETARNELAHPICNKK